MKKHIPNLLTLGNLLCGSLGIIHILEGKLEAGALFVFPALLLDFLDGFVARLLKVSSPIGKQLDSLADMVTFGVLPGILLYQLLDLDSFGNWGLNQSLSIKLSHIALTIPLFAALRLAKFNIDESQSDSFVGIPTPAATMFVVGLIYLFDLSFLLSENGKLALVFITILISLSMVAPVRMLNLKFKTYNLKENLFRYLLILFAIGSFTIFKLGGLSIIILVYMLLSVLKNMVTKREIK